MTPFAALLDGPLDARTLLAHLGYLASVVMFMLALIRMSRVKTAGGANTLAAAAMALAVVSQLVELGTFDPTWLAAGFLVGGLVGGLLAARVSMTGMPELVALLNGFGGFASTLVGVGTWFHWVERRGALGSGPLSDAFTGVNLMLTIVLGNLTFTGSLVAYLKLSEKMPTRPLLLPARNAVNLALFLAALALSIAAAVAFTHGSDAATVVWLVTGVTLLLGATLVLPIGGGDMPVVISLHDSFAGFAGALAGFAIGSPVLIVAGTIVGAAGMILTRIMCKSMNRGMWNVVLGGFGAVTEQAGAGGGYGTVRSADAEEAAMVLADARTCIVVPGYGMAVAQAQHAVRELGDLLEKRGCKVRYAVHPVAGRMPGHMNVLLAEANVPYDKLFEMDAIDSDFKNTDVAIVIGANDVVNPAAKTNPQSPLYGMPVLSVDEAKTVFVIKRSLGSGFAGVKNELFERENTRMIYADAKKAVEDVVKALKDA